LEFFMTDSSELALRHFEKAFFVLACGGLFLAWAFAPPDPALQVASLEQDLDLIDVHMRQGQPIRPASSDAAPRLEARLSVVPDAELFPSWLPYRRIGVLARERQTIERAGEHGASTLTADLLGRSVRLTWVEPKVSEFLVRRYSMERQLDGGPWEALGTFSDGQTTHLDEGLAPRVAYRYRLTSTVSIDPIAERRSAARRERLVLAAQDRIRVGLATPALTLAPDVFLIPHTVWVADPLERKEARAYVTVWIRTETGFRKKGFPVERGSLIGAEIEVGRRTVDFRSHAVLVSVSERVAHRPEGRKTTTGVIEVRWPDGKVEEILTTASPPE
jgi:hypothetical protein